MQDNDLKDNNFSQENNLAIITLGVILFAIIIIIGLFICNYDNLNQFSKQPNDTSSYMTYMQKSIKKNWSPPSLPESAQVVVLYFVLNDGTITDIQIKKSSDNAELDNSVIEALENTTLPPLPPELVNEKGVTVEFNFDYNVFKDSEK